MSPELITAIEEAMRLLESWRGRLVRVEAWLCRGVCESWEHDRHFCAMSRFTMVVKDVRWRFSGGVLMVYGSFGGELCDHEVHLEKVVEIGRPDEESMAFKERFGQVAQRLCVFRLVGDTKDAESGAAPDQASARLPR